MSKFEVGTRIIVTDLAPLDVIHQRGANIGDVGTIILDENDGQPLVEFGEDFVGHKGYIELEFGTGHCWFIFEENMEEYKGE